MQNEGTSQTTEVSAPRIALPGWLTSLLRLLITGSLPVLLILINARFLMSDVFLQWEYTRPWLPEDPYGFTQSDRIEYAPLALAYLTNSEGIEFLGDQTFPDGAPLYNDRELSHMVDVKNVTLGLTRFGTILLVVNIVALGVFFFSGNSTRIALAALRDGVMLTVILLVGGLILVASSFNWLFTAFHGLFFEGDTWIFLNSDTLIRLFPIRFWTDAFALMFGGALLEAVIIGGVSWRRLRRTQ